MICEECGSDNVDTVRTDGPTVQECALCGALFGDDEAVSAILLAREAREKGIDPQVYPLILTLRRLDGMQIVQASAGDPELRVWPFVQMAPAALAWRSVENLVKSLALSARGQEVHWVIEVEYQNRLVLTLKPRFHRGVGEITPQLVAAAQADLTRIQRNLEAHMNLSWWR